MYNPGFLAGILMRGCVPYDGHVYKIHKLVDSKDGWGTLWQYLLLRLAYSIADTTLLISSPAVCECIHTYELGRMCDL